MFIWCHFNNQVQYPLPPWIWNGYKFKKFNYYILMVIMVVAINIGD